MIFNFKQSNLHIKCKLLTNNILAQTALLYCYYHRSAFLFLFSLLLLTHFGKIPEVENLFPPIFWHTQKIYAKQIHFLNSIPFLFLSLTYFYFCSKKKRNRKLFWLYLLHYLYFPLFKPLFGCQIQTLNIYALFCPFYKN